MNNVASLKALYLALGGDSADVAEASTIVGVLNAIAVLLGGDGDAVTNAEAIDNITSVASALVPDYEDIDVTPTTSEQEITATSGKTLRKVTVAAVTAAIDDNITAGNIKDGVTILGVTGTYDGT
ncbi:MAG: hypothetical protein UIH27_12395 [Ruminococcus sp.]|nr:hypothetical protein [Ruminococcus sp.]